MSAFRRRRRDPAAAAAIVARWRRRTGGPQGGSDLVAAWRELGADGAGAVPTRVSRNGVVTVACTDAMRAQQIAAAGDELIERLSRMTGAPLSRIDTVIADHAVEFPVPEEIPPAPIPENALRAAREVADGLSAEITDPEVRDAVARAAARAIARSWERKEGD